MNVDTVSAESYNYRWMSNFFAVLVLSKLLLSVEALELLGDVPPYRVYTIRGWCLSLAWI
jgi:hypothetical protein